MSEIQTPNKSLLVSSFAAFESFLYILTSIVTLVLLIAKSNDITCSNGRVDSSRLGFSPAPVFHLYILHCVLSTLAFVHEVTPCYKLYSNVRHLVLLLRLKKFHRKNESLKIEQRCEDHNNYSSTPTESTTTNTTISSSVNNEGNFNGGEKPSYILSNGIFMGICVNPSLITLILLSCCGNESKSECKSEIDTFSHESNMKTCDIYDPGTSPSDCIATIQLCLALVTTLSICVSLYTLMSKNISAILIIIIKRRKDFIIRKTFSFYISLSYFYILLNVLFMKMKPTIIRDSFIEHTGKQYLWFVMSFIIIQSLLTFLYQPDQRFLSMNNPLIKNWKSSLQHVFTFGEWISISSLLTLSFVTYYSQHYFSHQHTMQSLQNDECKFVSHLDSHMTPSHLIVSHAGIVGCLIACSIPLSSISQFIIETIRNVAQHCSIIIPILRIRNGKCHVDGCSSIKSIVAKNEKHTLVFVSKQLECFLQSLLVVLVILSFVDYGLQSHGVQPDLDFANLLLNKFSYNYWLPNHGFKKYENGKYLSLPAKVPISIIWLFEFLLQTEPIRNNCVGSDCNAFINKISHFPRFFWLVYWVSILAAAYPISILIAKMLWKLGSESTKSKSKVTIISRKFFHILAVLLFGPPTFFAPQMMSLSYAVAAALLILLEKLRAVISIQQDVMNKTSNQDNELYIPKDNFEMKNFYNVFFDEKDLKASKKGGFVISHISLVLGCALPLWVTEYFNSCHLDVNAQYQHNYGISLRLLPFLGINVLGIGDTVAAVLGSLFGRYRWPGRKRTLEGSFFMLVSMIMFVLFLELMYQKMDEEFSILYLACYIFIVLIPLTLLESSTTQIDNICLPMKGVCFSLILHLMYKP